ncbi:hypothetical protein, partial [[Eubacterium] cellulosolvens]
MKEMDPTKLKKKKLLLLQSLEELHKNAEDLWKTASKQAAEDSVDFNYFYSKYIKYLKVGKALYGKKILEFKITISDSEYQKLSGLKKIITEMGLLIVFIKDDVGNIFEENKRLKKQLLKYKQQAMA